MWNTMPLSLITSLFILLSVAAPITEDPALSRALAKRSTHCDAKLGYSIETADCYEALDHMGNLPQFQPDRGNGILSFPHSEFSRTAPDSRFRLPQAFTVRSCTVFVDLAPGQSSVIVTRTTVPTGALRIIKNCVRGLQRTGGIDTGSGSGIGIAIANERNLDVQFRPRWEQCMAVVRDNTPFDEHAQCLLYELEVDAAAQARERAGVPGTHVTSKR